MAQSEEACVGHVQEQRTLATGFGDCALSSVFRLDCSNALLRWADLPWRCKPAHLQEAMVPFQEWRFVAPFVELGSDVLGLACSAADIPPISGMCSWASSLTCHRTSTLPALVGMQEIAEDIGLKDHREFLPLVLTIMVAPSLTPITLCGLVIPTKLVYGTVGFFMTAAAMTMKSKHPELRDRTVPWRASGALLTSSTWHLVLMYFGGVPDPLALHAAYPAIAAHYVQDFVFSPLVILNLGYMAGVKGSDLKLPIAGSICGAGCAFAAAVAPTASLRCGFFLAEVCSLAIAGRSLSSLTTHAQKISVPNKVRTQLTTDFFLFSWTLYPVCQALGLLGSISVPTQVQAMALIDILTKCGTCHLMLKSEFVLARADQFFEQEVVLF